MIVNKVICDMCGKEFDSDKYNEDCYKLTTDKYSTRDYYTSFYAKEYHLCEQCVDKVIKFIDKKDDKNDGN